MSYLLKLRSSYLLLLALGMTGCASEELSNNALEVGVASNNLMYQTVLYNIAMIRYYQTYDKYGHVVYNDVIPVDTHISAGQDVVNDTAGVTASGALGGAHGIVVPSVSLPYTHSVQQQANSSPSSDGLLLSALMTLYHNHAGDSIFQSGTPPLGTRFLSSQFETTTVWVDQKNIGQLSDLALDVLGHSENKDKIPGNEIYNLRQNQAKNQANKSESAPATSIRTL